MDSRNVIDILPYRLRALSNAHLAEAIRIHDAYFALPDEVRREVGDVFLTQLRVAEAIAIAALHDNAAVAL